MISRFLLPLILGIVGLQATENSYTSINKLDVSTRMILQQEQVKNAYHIVSLIKKQPHDLKASLFYDIFSWCLHNKKIKIVHTLLELLPTCIYLQKTTPDSPLFQCILKDIIILQLTFLLPVIFNRIPSHLLKKQIIQKDINGYSLTDYADQTGNKEIIDLLNIQKLHKETNIFSSILRAIGCIVTLFIIVPIMLWVIPFLLTTIGQPATALTGAVDILVFGLFYYFPVLLATSLICFTNPVMRLFKFEPLFKL